MPEEKMRKKKKLEQTQFNRPEAKWNKLTLQENKGNLGEFNDVCHLIIGDPIKKENNY